nr:histidine phosphatase family protein [Campylobacterota bacterium]
MRLTLLRHAEVSVRYQGCYNGWIDIDIEKREPIGMFEDITFDAIYSSDLKRCKQTLALLSFPRYQIDQRLREIRFKPEFEGKSFECIDPPQEALYDMSSWYDYICDEKFALFRERVRAFLSSMQGEEVLICAHGGTIRMILSLLQERDFYTLFEQNIRCLEYVQLETN